MPVLGHDREPDVHATFLRGRRRMREALGLDRAADGGQVDELFSAALDDFVWFWRRGLEYRPSMVGVRGSFLLGRFVELAGHYEPALEFLDAEVSRLTQSVRVGEVSRCEFYDLHALLRAFERYDDFGAAFDVLVRVCPALADEVGARCWEMFVLAGRLDLFRAHAPEPLVFVEQQMQILDASYGADQLSPEELGQRQRHRRLAVERACDQLSRGYTRAGLMREAGQLEVALRELFS